MRYKVLVSAVLLFLLTSASHGQHYVIDSLKQALAHKNDPKTEIDILNNLAFEYTKISVPESEKYVQDAIRKAQRIRYQGGLAESFKTLGNIATLQGDYSRSVEYCYEALKLYEETGNKSGQSKVLNNLGQVLMTLNEYDRAYQFINRSLKLKREIGDSVGVANAILALSEYNRHKGNFDLSLQHSEDALARLRALNNEIGIAHSLFQYGETYFEQRKFLLASTYYNNAIRHARLANDEMLVIETCQRLGQLFLKVSEKDSGYFFLHQALKLSRLSNSRKNEMRACEQLSNYFVADGQYDSAFFYARTTVRIQEDIFRSQRSQQVTTMQMLYDFEKNEQELNFQKAIVKRQFVAIVGVSLILILATVLGLKFYRLNKTNQQSKEELLKLNAEIHKMNENLETVVRDRTEELKQQNQRLIEYAFFTAHEVRGPLARILGLVELSKINTTPEDRVEILKRLEISAYELDEIIRMINRKLENGKRL